MDAQIDRSPELAGAQIIRLLRAPAEDPAHAADLDAMAGRLAKRLRMSGKAAAALEVAAAGRRRTTTFRMEEALAAFALGSDDVAAAATGEDERVASVVGPLLRAARGEEEPSGSGLQSASGAPGPDKPALRPGPQPAELRAIRVAARAVGHAVRGQTEKARSVLRRVDRAQRRNVLAPELGAAIEVADPDCAAAAMDRLTASELVRASGSVRRAVIAEASAHGSPLILELLGERFPDATAEEIRLATMPVLRARLRSSTSPAVIAGVVRNLDLAAFPEADRAAAAIYGGFGLLDTDPDEAARRFDRAIELGGDLLEALRGKLLAAMAAAERAPRRREGASRDIAMAADRLGSALGRDAQGRALGAAAETIAAAAWIEAKEARSAEAAIATARRLGACGAEIDLLEAQAVALRDPAAAGAQLDVLLSHDRADARAWRLKIDIARAQGDRRAADAALLEAAAATRDPGLVDEARRVRSRSGEIAPFEGFAPNAVSPGALALELARVTEEKALRTKGTKAGKGDPGERDALNRMNACRDALTPSGRLAIDAAAIAISATLDQLSDARRYLHRAFEAWSSSPRELTWIAAVAILVALHDELVEEACALPDHAPALPAITEALVAAGLGPLAEQLLPRFAGGLQHRELDRLCRLIRESTFLEVEIPGVPDPRGAARELDLTLAPEFSILGFVQEHDDEEEELQELPPGMLAGVFLELIGAQPEALDRLPPSRRRQVELEMAKLLAQTPGDRAMERMAELFTELGISPRPPGPRPAPRRRRV